MTAFTEGIGRVFVVLVVQLQVAEGPVIVDSVAHTQVEQVVKSTHDLHVVLDLKDLVVHLALLGVEIGIVFSHFVVHWVEHVHSWVVLKLVPTPDMPQEVLLLDTFSLCHCNRQFERVGLPVGFLPVDHVQSLN